MKKLFTFLSAFILLSIQSLLATNVSGTISINTIWNQAGSPYIITASATVNNGIVLTVDSGVTVNFANGQNLTVLGTLNANNVIFSSSNPSPTPGIWGYIQTGNATTSGTVNLTNCQVMFAQHFYVFKGTATLMNTDLMNFSLNGVNISATGILNMTNGSINTSAITASYGIYGNGIAFLTNVNIQHFTNGIYLTNNSYITLEGSTITNCTWPINYFASADLILNGSNFFSGNTNTAINMGFSSFSDTLRLPVANIPYYFPNGMIVNSGGLMQIGSNNILKFANNKYLDVSGSFIANANISENIYFTSFTDDNWGGDANNDGSLTAPTYGKWFGIRFLNTSIDANSLMRRCKIRYAGSISTGGISTFDASPTIDSCDISNNYYGIYMQFASNPILTNNTIGSSQMTPIAMSFEANPLMSNNALSFSDNAFDAIGLIGGTLTTNAILKIRSVTTVPNITYLLLGDINIPVGIQLTINKGIVIKSHAVTDRFLVSGIFTANASLDSMITFTSAKDDNYGNPGDCNKDGTITFPAVGDWGGIIFLPGSSGYMNYCRFNYAQIDPYTFTSCSINESINSAAVAMIDASPGFANCVFNNLTYGISCYRSSNPVISNCSMTNIQYTPFCLSGASNPGFSGISFTNVGWQAIGLLGGDVCQNSSIIKRDLAGFINISYILLSDLTINSGTYIDVESGVVIKMNSNVDIFVEGGFRTNGSISQKVVFTTIKDDNEGNPFDTNGDGNATSPTNGSWGSIFYKSSSDDLYSIVNNAVIKYGGSTGVGNLTYENAGGQFINSSITNSLNYGIYCNGNSNPLIDNVSIQNCTKDPIAMSLLSNPTFTNISFAANESNAIRIIEGTLSSDATLATRSIAGITNIAYIVDNLTISNNAKLTILPDVVIKFRDDNSSSSSIIVYGNMLAKGNNNHKIYFTSYKDDSKGGDSNNDGNTTSPTSGSWGTSVSGGIQFVNNSINSDSVNYLKNCELSYSNTAVNIENSHVTFDSCIIQQTLNYGANIIGSANPLFTECQFVNIPNAPVKMSMFSNPVFSNCSMNNVGIMALSVFPEVYTQSATIPSRNFGGYTNISYYLEGNSTINSGTTITIPSGIVFKSNSVNNNFIVNGRLNVMGTALNPVVFTRLQDDNYGNPLDMNNDGLATLPPVGSWGGTWITFNDVSNDSSIINNTIFKYANVAISTLSASPIIKNSRFESLTYGIDMSGVSVPKIDTCVFHNLQYYPMQISLVSYPATTANNIISGTTYKVLKVKDETLTQDVALIKHSFGGVNNIPYLFNTYTIGSGATLTINPGVVCKFSTSGSMNVQKGLLALGGFAPDSNIVFTGIKDDFYGGDSNADTTATTAARGNWYGLVFPDQSIDGLCRLRNCIIRYSNYSLHTTSASPSIDNCNFNNNNYGVYATAASNPVINNCDFNDNYNFAVNNVNKSFVINALNCWWGSNLGPIQTNTAGNGTSVQELVTTSVNYTPWKSTGSVNPLMGDVSQNGLVQGYDAALVLQYVVNLIGFNSAQQTVADVSGVSGISAYDASLIAQYVVGSIQSFPTEQSKAHTTAISNPVLTLGSSIVSNGQEVSIPVSLTNVSGMYSTDIKIKYDPAYLQLTQLTNMMAEMNLAYNNDSINGILNIAMAGINPLQSDTVIVMLSFHTSLPIGITTTTSLNVMNFLANENNMTNDAVNGSVCITGNANGIYSPTLETNTKILQLYPNPSTGNAVLSFQLNGDKQMLNIEVYNMIGQKIACLINETRVKGKYSVDVSNQGVPLDYGSYLIRLTVDGITQSKVFQVVR